MEEKSIFSGFPEESQLLEWYKDQPEMAVPGVNGHIHTPNSFSAFSETAEAFKMANEEGVQVLGVNDFYTTGGYDEFAEAAQEWNVFPLFNIEFIALQRDLQASGIRVNDPNNPGRTYFSGKGLRHPVKMSAASQKKIRELQEQSNRQTTQMVEKVNAFFSGNGIDIQLDAGELKKRLAKNLFRERHLAQGIRLAVYEKEDTAEGRKQLFKKIFSGKELKSPLEDLSSVENEIRGNLLKSGGVAFVPEDPKAFLSLDEVIAIITDAGGIPCYPVLLDNPKGEYTDFEGDWEKLYQRLTGKNVYSLELIPGRNDLAALKDFVSFFREKGFVITFGTEHNTPQLIPLKVSCRGAVPLDEALEQVNYEGAAVIAAHQYLLARGKEGYLKGGMPKVEEKAKFAALGRAVIAWFFNS